MGDEAGFLKFLTEFPGEIRLVELIFRRPGKLGLGENPFPPYTPPEMIEVGGLRPSKPPHEYVKLR